MTVYKGYMKLIARNYKICLIYLIIFLGIAFIIMASTKQREDNMFVSQKFTVAVFDNDKSAYSEGLKKFIEENHYILETEYDEEKLEKQMYGRNLDYVLIIPENFGQDIKDKNENGVKVDIIKAKNVNFDVFFTFSVENYLNTLIRLDGNFQNEEDVVAATNQIFKDQVEVEILKSNETSDVSDLYYFFRFLPMLFISIFGYIVGFIMITFKNKDLQNRCNVSGISQRRQYLEILLALITFAALVYLLVVAIGLIFFKSPMDRAGIIIYYIINSFVCVCFSAGIAFLIGAVARSYSGLNAWVNIFSNILCFLGGVYVPMSLLAPAVRNVSKLMPTYWYELNNTMIGNHFNFTDAMKLTFARNLGLQLLIMIVFVGFSLVISKKIARHSK